MVFGAAFERDVGDGYTWDSVSCDGVRSAFVSSLEKERFDGPKLTGVPWSNSVGIYSTFFAKKRRVNDNNSGCLLLSVNGVLFRWLLTNIGCRIYRIGSGC